MALRDILVHVDASDAGQRRLRLAADLAHRHAARLTALFVREYSIEQQHRLRAAELGLASGQRTDALTRDIVGELDGKADLLRALLSRLQQDLAIDVAWRSVDGMASKVVPQQSRYADLTVIGHNPFDNAALPDDYSFAETMLFTTGRPLVIVPAQELAAAVPDTLGRSIAIAWNGSRASACALSDALPLVQLAASTTVFVAEPSRLAHPDRVDPASILDHVGRHTAHVEYRPLQASNGALGDLLQDAALEVGADLLVCGAHGRPRLWEKMLGRVTHDLLTRIRMPLLVSC